MSTARHRSSGRGTTPGRWQRRATARSASSRLTGPPPRLPPGPRAAAVLQTLVWAVAPTWVLDHCAERYGDAFTLTFAPSGRKLVMLSDPEAVKTVFTAPPDLAPSAAGELADRAGDGAELGDHADRPRAHAPAQAAASAVPRRAHARVRADDRAGDTRATWRAGRSERRCACMSARARSRSR